MFNFVSVVFLTSTNLDCRMPSSTHSAPLTFWAWATQVENMGRKRDMWEQEELPGDLPCKSVLLFSSNVLEKTRELEVKG